MEHKLEQYLMFQAQQKHIPLKVTLELTPLCNFDCNMCYVRESYEKAGDQVLPLSFWLNLIPQMQACNTLYVALIGGEPMVYPHIQELYEALVSAGFYVNITSNGSMFAGGVPAWLLKHKPRYITISLYGFSDITYEKMTGHRDGFSLTMQGIQNLRNAGINVKLNCCVTPDMICELPAILEYAKTHQLPIATAVYTYPNNTRRTSDTDKPQNRLSPEQAAIAYWAIEKSVKPDDYLQRLNYFAQGNGSLELPECSKCQAGRSMCWINWQGELWSCGMINQPVVSLTEQENPFCDAWKILSKAVYEQGRDRECEQCEKRGFCGACEASIRAEKSIYPDKPDYICRLTDAKIEYARLLLEAEELKSNNVCGENS